MTKLERIKAKIQSNEPVIGVGVSLSDCSVTEILGLAGYDFIWIEIEHSAINNRELLHHLAVARGTGAAAFVRVPWNDPVLVKPIIDMGPDAIIFPFIKSVEDAKLAISSCRYPPVGIRGFGPGRAIDYGLKDALQYINEADSLLWKVFMIEHIDAVNNLEEILNVDGVDAFIVGSNDLSGSMGLLGQTQHSEVKKVMDKIAVIAGKLKKPMGLAIGQSSPEVIKEWVDRGMNFISVGGDTGFILSGAIDNLNTTKKLLQK